MPGGLSGIKKSININGQPHSLAWINPGEASALRAMGGSGKPGPGGIPSYQWGDYPAESYQDQPGADVASGFSADTATGVEDYGISAADMAAVYDDIGIDTRRDYTSDDTHGTSREDLEDHGAAYGVQKSLDPETATGYLSSYEGGDFVPTHITSESLMEKGVPDKLVPYWNALRDRGMSNQEAADYLAGMEAEQLASMSRAYDTGYSFGGPMGTMGGLTRDMATAYAKKLKLKELEDEIEGLDSKLSSEERTEQIRDIFSRYDILDKGKLTATKDYKGMGSDIEAMAIERGINPTIAKALSWAAPGMTWSSLIAGAGNALAALAGVRGEFETEGGKTFRVMRGGELVEPDMPSVPDPGNIESVTETVGSVVDPSPKEVDKPLTGIAANLAKRPEVASIAQSRQAQFDNIASIFGREEAAKMLNLPENIFA